MLAGTQTRPSRRNPTTRNPAHIVLPKTSSNLMQMVRVSSDSTGSSSTQRITYLTLITISTQLSMVVIAGSGVCSTPSKSGSSPETLSPLTPLFRRPDKSCLTRSHPMIKMVNSFLLNRVIPALTRCLKLMQLNLK